MILDSTFLVDVLRGSAGIDELLEELDASGPPFVSAVTVMELYEGINLTDATAEEREAVERVLEGLTEVPFDRPIAMRAGRISAALVDAGEPIDETDVMIAATALEHDQPVVTRNERHFERVDGVNVVSY